MNNTLHFRLFLAALHFNENGNRKQARTSHGEKVFAVSYPRGRNTEAVARAVKVPQTFGKYFCVFTLQ